MTIENLKQIAIKYATTKGSRVPLAPDELCNAVVQYFNEFLKITADINTLQVAVTEEGGNIVFTITGNTLDGKAFTPIVITVDHNDFGTDQEFEAFKTTTNAAIQKNTESINRLSFRVEDTENDITTIQVQAGQIKTRVGNTETKITKINSTLNNKLDKINSVSNSNQVYGKSEAGKNLMYNLESHPNAGFVLQYDSDGNIYVNKGSSEYTPANMQNISDVEAKIPDVTNLADVTKENTFTGENTFNNSIYAKNGVVAGDTTNYGANSVTKGSNTYSFPNKSGTFAMTTDIIKNPIYFISFYANDPSEPCHLIGTMMSKNSYGTGQKTNEEFAVMLADNLYMNSNEGLAAYGKLANKDILCIYSEDGLSIRCLDEENSEVDLPMVMFFVMETKL